ncbi:MAG: hypothetical protein IKW32_06860 [Bacteroidaceae bacterium]|nr:hypothetical protein [Bacteroidaceae bacterium]
MKKVFHIFLLLMLTCAGCDFPLSTPRTHASLDNTQRDSIVHLPLKALNAFHQAIRIHKTHSDYTLLGEAYDQMGNLFMEQQLHDEALDMKQKALHYYQLQKDTVSCSYVHRDLGRIHISRRDTAQAKENFERAYRLIVKAGTPQQANEITGEVGCFYLRYANHEEGKYLLMMIPPCTPEILFGLGAIYKEKEMPDSAMSNWHRTMQVGNLYHRRSASKELMLLYRELGREAEAKEYEACYRLLEDSARHISSPDTIAKTHLLLSYQTAEMENQLLELENHTYRIWMYLLSAALLVGAMGVVLILQRQKHKKHRAIEQERYLRILQEHRYEESLASIQQNEAKLKELENKLAEAENREDNLSRQLLLSQKELLEATNRKNLAVLSNREWQEQAFQQSKIYIHFHRAAHEECRLSPEDWQELQATIDTTYPHFTARLHELCPQLTPQEVQICLLIKISMANKHIARFMACQPSTISHARKRLCKKLTGMEGTAEKFDQFIADL